MYALWVKDKRVDQTMTLSKRLSQKNSILQNL